MIRIDQQAIQKNASHQVYAIVDRRAPAIGKNWAHRKQYGFVESGELIAIVSLQPQQQTCLPSAEQMTAFSEAVAHLHQTMDVLPFRFSKAVPLQDIVRLLAQHQSAYQANLKQIAGCTELNARWVLESQEKDHLPGDVVSEDDRPSSSGSNYLRERHRVFKRQRQIESELKEISVQIGLHHHLHSVDVRSSIRRLHPSKKFRTAADDSTHEPTPAACSIAALEVLVHRTEVSYYLNALSTQRFGDRAPVLVSGPWPPYSFVIDVPATGLNALSQAPATAKAVQNCAIFSTSKAAS